MFNTIRLRHAIGSVLLLGFSHQLIACSAHESTTPPSEASERTQLGNGLSMSQGWIRQPPPGAPVSAAYLQLHNESSAAIDIIAAEFTGAKKSEFHSMSMSDSMMRMRHMEALSIQAGETLHLEPGGTHLMLMGLSKPYQAGDSVTGKFIDANGKEYPLSLSVQTEAP